MNPNQSQLPSSPQHLGRRAFTLIVSKHMRLVVVLLVIAVAAFIARGEVGANDFMNQISMWSGILFFISLAYAFLAGWLIYANYTFSLEDDAFRISRGVFSKKETAIPYRQIRDVNIERSVSQRMMGVSKLVILTVGEEGLSSSVSESVIPVVDNIDKNMALVFQNELLKRANVQKISQS